MWLNVTCRPSGPDTGAAGTEVKSAVTKKVNGCSLEIAFVALDTMRQMESQMMMRSYEGFLR